MSVQWTSVLASLKRVRNEIRGMCRGGNSIVRSESGAQRPRNVFLLTMDMSPSFVPLGLSCLTATRSTTFCLVETEKRSVGEPRDRAPPKKNYGRNRTVYSRPCDVYDLPRCRGSFQREDSLEIKRDVWLL